MAYIPIVFEISGFCITDEKLLKNFKHAVCHKASFFTLVQMRTHPRAKLSHL